MSSATRQGARSAQSAALATLLSFIWPGLGQWYAGKPRAALLYAVPVLVAVVVLLLQLTSGFELLGARLLDPTFTLLLIGLVALAGAWRIASMADAIGDAGGRIGARPRRSSLALLGALSLVVVVTHVVVVSYVLSFYDASSKIFVGASGAGASGAGASGAGTSGAGASGASNPLGGIAIPTPDAAPQSASARITILVAGIDNGAANRTETLTDTLLVMSVDPATGTAVMLSIPRDTSDFPLYLGGTYSGKINSLLESATLNPKQFPDGPVTTLTREIGYLIGVPVQYFAAINLAGFQQMIDLVGGIDVVNPKPIDDPLYDWFDGTHGFYLAAGPQHLDGRTALAYVRSRQGLGDSDYTRAARQQQVLVALKQKLATPQMLGRFQQILLAATRTIRTDFPANRVADMIALGRSISASSITKVVLGPPYSYHPPSETTGGIWTSRLYPDRLAALSVQLFGLDSRYATATPPATPPAIPPLTASPSTTPPPIPSPTPVL